MSHKDIITRMCVCVCVKLCFDIMLSQISQLTLSDDLEPSFTSTTSGHCLTKCANINDVGGICRDQIPSVR